MSARRIILIIGVILLLLGGLGAGVYLVLQNQNAATNAAPATTVSFSPVTKQVQMGDTTDFSVLMNTQTNVISSANIEIIYNPRLITIESITNGTFLPVVLSQPQIDNTQGSAKIKVGATAGSAPQGQGTVLTFKVKAVAQGNATLAFGSATRAAGANESVDVINQKLTSSVTVTFGTPSTPTPTPTPDLSNVSTSSATVATNSATATTSATVSGKKPTANLPANKSIQVGSVIKGTAEPSSVVNISLSNQSTLTSTADTKGNWASTIPATLTAGDYTLVLSNQFGTTTTAIHLIAANSAPAAGFELPTLLIFGLGGTILLSGFALAWRK